MANISIETKKFTQLPTTQSLTDSSLMLARDVAGVKTIQFSDLRAQLQGQTYVQELKSKNILDSSRLEQGNISESTGADVVSTNRVRTGFIPVEASETYTASVGNSKVLVFAFLYNSGKTYLDYKILSGEGATSPTFTVSASTAYVRITVKNSDDSTITPANVTNFQLELGDTATPYVPFSLDTVGLTNRRFVQDWESKNILDQALIEQGALDGSTGAEVDWTARIRSEFTPIKPNTTYTVSYTGDAFPCMFYYSSTKDYVTCELSTTIVTSYTFTTPSGVAFVKFTWGKSNNANISPSDISNVQLSKGSQASLYVPYAMDNMELSEICRGLQDDGFIVVPKYSFADLGVSATDSAFFLAWLQKLGSNYDKYKEKFVCGRVAPNSYGAVYGQMYGGVANDNTPMYSGFTYITFNGMKYFGTNNGTFFLRAVNYTVEV